MVRAICTSGDQFQCVLGPAGSGKTFALDAAREAWQHAGYQVIGAADQGTAAEVLALGTGIRAETLEYWLTLLDTQPDPTGILTARTVLLVDEASTEELAASPASVAMPNRPERSCASSAIPPSTPPSPPAARSPT